MLVAVDVETTGLDPNDHELLEIAVRVLEPTAPFDPIDQQTFHRYIEHDPAYVRSIANEYVRAMHDTTKLWGKLEQGYPYAMVDDALLDYLQRRVPKGKGRIMGNSIRLDMNFMDKYLPKSMEWLHYRSLDVTSLTMFAHDNFGIEPFDKDRSGAHTAARDMEQSILELQYIAHEFDRRASV